MSSTTIRISHNAWNSLRELAARAGESMQAILDKAIEEYRRKCFLEEVNRAFVTLKRDPEAWKVELEERAIWDIVSDDRQEK